MKKQRKPVKTEVRKLTPQEEERIRSFQTMSSELRKEGYRQTSMMIGTEKSNKLALTMALPTVAAGMALFVLKNPDIRIGFQSVAESLLFIVGICVLAAVRELVRGVTWAMFIPNKFSDIEFGFVKETLTPYCTCRAPMGKKQYITGALMPLLLTGILPFAAGILTGSFVMMLFGVVMIASSAGDILIVSRLLKHQSDCQDQIVYDLPAQPGCMLFEK